MYFSIGAILEILKLCLGKKTLPVGAIISWDTVLNSQIVILISNGIVPSGLFARQSNVTVNNKAILALKLNW